ncbi:uncharacterized protein B0T23DRAFT_292836, partial [Neurospora hispaniola]
MTKLEGMLHTLKKTKFNEISSIISCTVPYQVSSTARSHIRCHQLHGPTFPGFWVRLGFRVGAPRFTLN